MPGPVPGKLHKVMDERSVLSEQKDSLLPAAPPSLRAGNPPGGVGSFCTSHCPCLQMTVTIIPSGSCLSREISLARFLARAQDVNISSKVKPIGKNKLEQHPQDHQPWTTHLPEEWIILKPTNNRKSNT